jgi:hypothetical protein
VSLHQSDSQKREEESERMNVIKRGSRSFVATAIGGTLLVAIAIWQFYLFVTFKGTDGVLDSQGGRVHLLVAIVAALLACLASFGVFSVLLRYDRADEMHITSPPVKRG